MAVNGVPWGQVSSRPGPGDQLKVCGGDKVQALA